MLALLTVLPLLAQEPAAAPPPKPSPVADQFEKGSAVAGAAGLEVLWASRLAEAVEGAKRLRDGRILIFFVEPDCGQCKRMEALVVPSTSFYAYTRDKVPLYEDVSTAEGKDLAQRLRIRGTPTWVVVTPDLLECGRQEGPTSQQGWVDAFIQVERGWAAYRKVLADEAAAPSNPQFVFEAARQTYQRGGGALAEARFQRLARDPKTPASIKEQALGFLTSIEMESGRFDDAVANLDTLIASAQDPTLKMRAELRRADVEIARGRKDLAAWRLKEFVKAHPGTPLATEAQALLDALQGKAAVPATTTEH
ncbi:MAG: thioredoxin fold domain-containing protein [Acidobacteriota bacterium]